MYSLNNQEAEGLKENAEERAHRSIIQLIVTNQYRPGDFLLELDIAAKLNMSRTPVSRALARLVSEGFLNKMPKKGCYIPLPTPEDAEQVFSARRVVEGEAAGRAALLATDKDIAWLQSLVVEDRKAVQNRQRDLFSRINENLHLGIAKMSQNAYLDKWIRNVFWRSNIYIFYFDNFYRSTKSDIPQKTPMQHAAIVQAIADRAPEEATRCMTAHIDQTYEALLMGG